MRIALADLKKSVSRRNGVPYLVPYFLRPGELDAQLAALIALHEAWLGRARASFPEERPAELVGDYRLARGLLTCLSDWYLWRSPDWPGFATADEAAALAAHDIAAPAALRLALYDAVNAEYGGYLPAAARESALDTFAAELGIARATLDALLILDTDPQAMLERMSDALPTPAMLAARYNQRALEAVLANAGVVEWVLPPGYGDSDTGGSGESLGTIVKRICFLARQMGVWYDVAFDEPADEPDTAPPLARVAERRARYATATDAADVEPPDDAQALSTQAARALRITLYGPQEVTVAPQAYGERLARLCRALLGYRRDAATPGRAALADTGLTATARVYLHGKPLTFTLDRKLLKLLRADTAASADKSPAPPSPLGKGVGGVGPPDPYDSALERRFAEEFAALERAGEARGWRLEREPEPLLVAETILVPDFALTRGQRRVYLEIAGYWRPGYRERKARKLAALRDVVSLAVAAPESARAEFAALDGQIPFLWYRAERVSAQALLTLLDRAYDDFPARLASLDLPRIRAEVETRGHIPPLETYTLLRCYTRTELAAALRALAGGPHPPAPFPAGEGGAGAGEASPDPSGRQAPEWFEGVGLCAAGWRDALLASLRAAVESAPGQRLPLGSVPAALAAAHADLAGLAEDAAAALAERAGLVVARASIFEAEVRVPGVESSAAEEAASERAPRPRRAQPRSTPQRRHTRVRYEAQPIFLLEGQESDGDDDAGPDTPTPTAAE